MKSQSLLNEVSILRYNGDEWLGQVMSQSLLNEVSILSQHLSILKNNA